MMIKVGLTVATKNREKLLLPLLMAYYAVNLPETEHQFGIKRGSPTLTPCHPCFSKR